MRATECLLLCLSVLLTFHCSKARQDDQRGQVHGASEVAGEENASGQDPVVTDTPAVTTDGGEQPPLKVGVEVDVSAMPEGFLDDIAQISRISPSKSLFYSKMGYSWLLDDEKQGVLTKLQSDISIPSGARLYVQEAGHFWMFSATSIAFPSKKPSEVLGQMTLLNVTPDILKDPGHRLLFIGPDTLILSNESKAYILLRNGDKVSGLNLDLPREGGQPVAVTGAGQGNGPDLFWFLTAEQLLVLKRSGNQWVWRVVRFKLELGVAEMPGQVAMWLSSEEKDVSFLGRTLVFQGGKLYDRNALKLTVFDEASAAIK